MEKRRKRLLTAAGALSAVAVVALGGVALADSGSTNGSNGDSSSESGPPALERMKERMPRLGKALHGEIVVKDGSDVKTVLTQSGKVTEVGKTSITVKSEDGYTKTYAVTDGTLVNGEKGKISEIEKGEEVRVGADKNGDKATATRIADSDHRPFHHRFKPGEPKLGDHLRPGGPES